MEISKEMHDRIEKVIRDRFGNVDRLGMEMSIDEDGEEILLIQVAFIKGTKSKGEFYGLTRLVRNAMDEQMQARGVFPLISLRSAYA